MTARNEQETSVSVGRDDDHLKVWTSSLPDLRALRTKVSQGRATELPGGDDEVGSFEIPVSEFNILGGWRVRRKPLTPEQKEAVAKRLAAGRS